MKKKEIRKEKSRERKRRKGRPEKKIIFTYFQLRKFSTSIPVQALTGLLLLLAVDCRTREILTSVAVLQCYLFVVAVMTLVRDSYWQLQIRWFLAPNKTSTC